MNYYLIIVPFKNIGVNAFRIEPIAPGNRCRLKPLNKQAEWLVNNRPFHVDDSWSFYGYCTGNECETCAIPHIPAPPVA